MPNGVRVVLFLLLSFRALAQAPDSLTALNNVFRQAYASARSRVVPKDAPVIVVSGDTAALIRGGRRTEGAINLPSYHVVKTIAHIPLAIFVTLSPGDQAFDADRLKTLEELHRLIPPARDSLNGLGLSPSTLARQDQIVRESTALIDRVRTEHRIAAKDLQSFTRRMSPLVMSNVAEAAKVQLDALNACVASWRKEMTAREWDALHVIVITPHMPREDNLHVQYFLRLLHEPFEGRRVIVAESLWEEPKALELYGTHLLDGSIGESFFADPMRMHRDLLGDAAKDYLPKLLP